MKTIELDITRYDLTKLIDTFGLRRGVEVGVLHGHFSYYLLKHSSLQFLWSVDSWEGKHAPRKADVEAHLREFAGRSLIQHGRSVDIAKMAAEKHAQFDFCYIDADHMAIPFQADIDAWLPLMKRPCIFAGHDYLKIRKVQVIPVVNKLADKLGLPIYLTREKWPSWFFILGEDD